MLVPDPAPGVRIDVGDKTMKLAGPESDELGASGSVLCESADVHSYVPTVRPHQERALAALGSCERAQVVMACGTGKTLVGRWHAERMGVAVAVVVVPSLSLVAQTLRQWRGAGSWAFNALITCSDPTTADGERERLASDGQAVSGHFWSRLQAQVTTDTEVVTQSLMLRKRDRPLVIFSTYHSAHVVASAVRAAGITVDLVVADEAHYLAGHPRAEFRVVLADELLPARSRLFMTATPVITTTAGGSAGPLRGRLSMDDTATFGPVAYRLDFADAISQQLLVNYRVCVFETPWRGDSPDLVAALVAAARRGVGSVLSFHGRVAKARAFAQAVDGLQLPDGRTVVARAVAGEDPTQQRTAALALLASRSPDQLVLVASARCLSEGVDIPAVDSVLFADPRSSQVDVIQAVGRALRPAPGKSSGMVIIPVSVPPGLDDDTALSTGSFATVWRVLRGLRSFDNTLASEFATLARNPSRRGIEDRSRSDVRIEFDMSTVRAKQLRARLVDFASPVWDDTFEELQQFVTAHGHAHPDTSSRLGQWCARQRRAHRAGSLDPAHAQRLASLPGWTWNGADQRWLDQYDQVSTLIRERRGLDLTNPLVAVLLLRVYEHGSPVTTVGRWCAQQRQAHRRGTLADWQQNKLAELDGWHWSLISEADAAAVDLLGEYVAWKGHANPPANVVEDDVPLGRWLNHIRRQRATGHLPQALLDEVTVVSPPAPSPEALRWYRPETLWLLGLEALRQFAAREGHACVPTRHFESLSDHSLDLHKWVTAQRRHHQRGQLIASRVKMLESVTGWRWATPVLAAPGPRSSQATTKEMDAGYSPQWVPARPTWDLINAMVQRGWPKAWIARELGHGNQLRLETDRITEAEASMVADLNRRVGNRFAPQRQVRRPMPSLVEILASEAKSDQQQEVA